MTTFEKGTYTSEGIRLEKEMQEMRDELKGQFPISDYFEREEALYWFANQYHSGQWSDLYSILCMCEFNPGRLDTYESLDQSIKDMVNYLYEIYPH